MKRLTIDKLILSSVRRNAVKSIGKIILVALISFSILFCWILTLGAAAGLEQIKARFGADILVLSKDSELDGTELFLNVVDSREYLDGSYVDEIQNMSNIKQASGQFFLASLGASCCDAKVNIVGINPDTDFTIQPWLEESFGGELKEGAVIIGSEIKNSHKNQIKLFDKEYEVAGKLAPTGTGLDESVFATMVTVQDIKADAETKGYQFPQKYNQENLLSAIYVKVCEGENLDKTVSAINDIDGVRAVRMQSMVESVSDSLGQASGIFRIALGILVLIAIGIQIVVYGFTGKAERKELLLYRYSGMNKSQIRILVVGENALLGVIGGILGMIAAIVGVFAFHVFITDSFAIPFLMPSIGQWIAGVLIAFAISFLFGPVLVSLIGIAKTKV